MKPKIRMAAALAAALLCLPAFALPAYAMADEPEDHPPQAETSAPEDTTTAKPFTPEGTGTVVDNATDQDGKEFYTIQTPNENVFYLVIDKQRSSENVYFLNAVTEQDLMALAQSAGEPVTVEPTPEPTPEPEPDPASSPEPEPAPKQGGGSLGTVLLVVAVVVLGGGAGWYLKIYRPKHQAPDLDEQDMLDYEPEGPGDGEAEADEEEGPPWEDGNGEEDEE